MKDPGHTPHLPPSCSDDPEAYVEWLSHKIDDQVYQKIGQRATVMIGTVVVAVATGAYAWAETQREIQTTKNSMAELRMAVNEVVRKYNNSEYEYHNWRGGVDQQLRNIDEQGKRIESRLERMSNK
jgi:small-conductance mechanosensitive channel